MPYAFTATHPAKSPFKWNDYGFEVDGPVRIPKLFDLRNRLFFMANDEWKTQRQNSQATYSVPTPAMFAGDFSAWPTTIYDPRTGVNGATKTPFPNNMIPSELIDPISKKFLNYYVPSNLPGFSNNYTQMNSSPNNRDAFTLRMDFVQSSKSQWTGRYSWGDENQASTGISITGSKILTNYEQYLGTNTYSFSPTLLNEARFGYTRFSNSLGTYSAYNVDTVSALGIPNLQPGAPVSWGVPFASFAGDGFAAIGDTQDGPYSSTTTRCKSSITSRGLAANTACASVSNTTARTSTRSATSSPAASSRSSRTPRRVRPKRAATPLPSSSLATYISPWWPWRWPTPSSSGMPRLPSLTTRGRCRPK